MLLVVAVCLAVALWVRRRQRRTAEAAAKAKVVLVRPAANGSAAPCAGGLPPCQPLPPAVPVSSRWVGPQGEVAAPAPAVWSLRPNIPSSSPGISASPVPQALSVSVHPATRQPQPSQPLAYTVLLLPRHVTQGCQAQAGLLVGCSGQRACAGRGPASPRQAARRTPGCRLGSRQRLVCPPRLHACHRYGGGPGGHGTAGGEQGHRGGRGGGCCAHVPLSGGALQARPDPLAYGTSLPPTCTAAIPLALHGLCAQIVVAWASLAGGRLSMGPWLCAPAGVGARAVSLALSRLHAACTPLTILLRLGVHSGYHPTPPTPVLPLPGAASAAWGRATAATAPWEARRPRGGRVRPPASAGRAAPPLQGWGWRRRRADRGGRGGAGTERPVGEPSLRPGCRPWASRPGRDAARGPLRSDDGKPNGAGNADAAPAVRRGEPPRSCGTSSGAGWLDPGAGTGRRSNAGMRRSARTLVGRQRQRAARPGPDLH